MNKTQLKMAIKLLLQLIRLGKHNRMSLFWAVSTVALVGIWGGEDLFEKTQLASDDELLTCSAHRRDIDDGDTMTVFCGSQKEKTRFYCISAPEVGSKQP